MELIFAVFSLMHTSRNEIKKQRSLLTGFKGPARAKCPSVTFALRFTPSLHRPFSPSNDHKYNIKNSTSLFIYKMKDASRSISNIFHINYPFVLLFLVISWLMFTFSLCCYIFILSIVDHYVFQETTNPSIFISLTN